MECPERKLTIRVTKPTFEGVELLLVEAQTRVTHGKTFLVHPLKEIRL
uniref:Uncharacterized protein n=1 Tax=Arundo donax TaxID=35708 RepID=A0A0A9G1P1_ARUDO